MAKSIKSVVSSNVVTLSAEGRKASKAEFKAAHIGRLFCDIGEAIGVYSTASEFDKADTITAVSALLVDAMSYGFDADQLKAPSKSNTGELWTVLVDAINAPRMANNLPELSKGTRDNYLSRIRAFVRDRGVQPLDLFGNLAVKKAQDGKKAQAKTAAPATPAEPQDKTAAVNARGFVALRDFLAAFITQNEPGRGQKVSPAMEQILSASDDLLDAVKDAIEQAAK